MKSFILDCLGAIAIVALALLSVPLFADYRSQTLAEGWLAQLQPTQQLIAARARERGTLTESGSGLVLPGFQAETPDFFRIEDNGLIVMKGGYSGLVLLLVPTLGKDGVSWRCVGGPEGAVPEQCRREYTP